MTPPKEFPPFSWLYSAGLKDVFAMSIAGHLAGSVPPLTDAEIAEKAYDIAEAMIAEREARSQ